MKRLFILFGLLFTVNLAFSEVKDSIKTIKENGVTFVLHEVEKGETFYSICKRYGANPSEAVKYNPSALEVIKTGDELKIPILVKVEVEVVANKEESKIHVIEDNKYTYKKYKVEKGETLYAISRKFNISVSEIKSFNKLESDQVNEGQELIVGKKLNVQVVEVIDSTHVTLDEISTDARQVIKMVDGNPENIGDIVISDANSFDNKNEGEEVTQSGFVKIITDMEINQNRNYVYHAKAKVGTIVLVTNPQTNKSIFARVLGPFNVAEEGNQGFIMQITSNIAESIGLKDKGNMLVQINFTK